MRRNTLLVLVPIFALLASACSMNRGDESGPTGVDLFPLYRHISDPAADMRETTVLWPLFRQADIRGRKHLRIFPLVSLHSGLTGPRAIHSIADWMGSIALFSRNSLRDGSETLYAVGAPYLLSYRRAAESNGLRSHRVHIAPLYPPFTSRPTVEIAANDDGDFSYSFLTLYCARRGAMHGAGLFPLFGIWSRDDDESGWYALGHLLADWVTESARYDFLFPLLDIDAEAPSEPPGEKTRYRRTFIGPILLSRRATPEGTTLYKRALLIPVFSAWKDLERDACSLSVWPLLNVGAVGNAYCWQLLGPVLSGYGMLPPPEATPKREERP